jgi:hypothetical protein
VRHSLVLSALAGSGLGPSEPPRSVGRHFSAASALQAGLLSLAGAVVLRRRMRGAGAGRGRGGARRVPAKRVDVAVERGWR